MVIYILGKSIDSQLDIAKTVMRIMILYGHTDGLMEERPSPPVR